MSGAAAPRLETAPPGVARVASGRRKVEEPGCRPASSSARSASPFHESSIMPNREPGSCPHEPRPGTVVCLYCRHEEHVAGAGRRRARGSLIGASLLATALAAGALL